MTFPNTCTNQYKNNDKHYNNCNDTCDNNFKLSLLFGFLLRVFWNLYAVTIRRSSTGSSLLQRISILKRNILFPILSK